MQKAYVFILILSLFFQAKAAIDQLEFQKDPQAKSFAELTEACQKKDLNSKYLSETLQPEMMKRGTDLDVRGILDIYLHCASDSDKPMLLERLSNELMLAQPRALIEGLVKESVPEEFLHQLAYTNHVGFDLKKCDLECLTREQKAYDERMELISDLPLDSIELEKRNVLLHEMRLALAEVKTAEFESKQKEAK